MRHTLSRGASINYKKFFEICNNLKSHNLGLKDAWKMDTMSESSFDSAQDEANFFMVSGVEP